MKYEHWFTLGIWDLGLFVCFVYNLVEILTVGEIICLSGQEMHDVGEC